MQYVLLPTVQPTYFQVFFYLERVQSDDIYVESVYEYWSFTYDYSKNKYQRFLSENK